MASVQWMEFLTAGSGWNVKGRLQFSYEVVMARSVPRAGLLHAKPCKVLMGKPMQEVQPARINIGSLLVMQRT